MKINFDFLNEYINIHSPGYVIEIYNNGKFFEKAVGYKSIMPVKKLCDTNTLYDIASLTKTFTATLIYIAYQENKLSLDNSVYEIDNDFINLKKITIKDLLCHNQEIYTKGYLGETSSKVEFLNVLHSAYVKNNVPTYVDVHYIILSHLLEIIYGISFDKLIYNKICKPLNLTSVTFFPDSNNCASNEILYDYYNNIIDNEGIVNDKKARKAKEFGLCIGHAGLFCSGKDLLKFLISFLNCDLLSEEIIRLMLKHNNIEKFNLSILEKILNKTGNINDLYNETKEMIPDIYIPLNYNYMGARYKNKILALNDVVMPSNNSICFSGYTGPMYQIDFENKIIIVIMCNLLHNTKLNRKERKDKTVEIIENIIKQIN